MVARSRAVAFFFKKPIEKLFVHNHLPAGEGHHRSCAIAVFPALGADDVIFVDPAVGINLKIDQGVIDLLAKGHMVKLVLDRFRKVFTDAICLRAVGYHFRLVKVLDGRSELMFVVFP